MEILAGLDHFYGIYGALSCNSWLQSRSLPISLAVSTTQGVKHR